MKNKETIYDVIVAGAGHAGCEAAYIAAKLGSKVLLITTNMDAIAQMSCNPSIGGVAKGQIVREIDALGGMMGIIADKTAIQFRMLNSSKGPAMWSPRMQIDRAEYSKEWRKRLENTTNLFIREDAVVGLKIEKGKIQGVYTKYDQFFTAKTVIITSGTFLNGIIHIGEKQFSGGRMKEEAIQGLTENLKEYGIFSRRMKTGTPVRIDGRTIDFSKLIEQPGDENPQTFSFSSDSFPLQEQRSCYLVYTDKKVHDILRKGFDKSPMFVGRIQGIGPRYCPSIEDKIERFSDKDRHQLFLEPEGWNTIEYYLNGFSSSLPEEIQYEALQQIPGFENAHIFRPGYAIEYDFFPPSQIKSNLETKNIQGLFLAGQVNGTTGYEEAAAQGVMAGINAHLSINEKEAFVLSRSQAYIGVLIDDLITKEIDEPYRMFTSRAEFRILLRQDNADIRLSEIAYKLGTLSKERINAVNEKIKETNSLIRFLKTTSVSPIEVNAILKDKASSPIKQKVKMESILLRPEISIFDLLGIIESKTTIKQNQQKLKREILEQTEILIKYDTYIKKEKELSERIHKYDQLRLRKNMDYKNISALSIEAREKLEKNRPETIGQASRISGISPADISALLVLLQK